VPDRPRAHVRRNLARPLRAARPVAGGGLAGGDAAGGRVESLGERLRRHEPARRHRGRGERGALDGRAPHGAARRRAGDGEGPAHHGGLPDAAGQPNHGHRTGDRGRAGGDGPEVRGRRHHRQDHHDGVRLEDAGRLPAARHHPQPLEPRADAGRLLLRRRRGGGGVLRAAACRHRCRRLHPHPGSLLRAGGGEALLRPGAAVAARRLFRRGLRRAHGAHGARRGADALRHGAAGHPRPVLPAGGAARLAGRHRGRRGRAAGGGGAPPRLRPAARCGRRGGARRRRAHVGGRGRGRGGGRPRPAGHPRRVRP
ncbi:MAG: Aspartyl-tRNA(Asn) amidotransferase subunit A @ Glutamyl-tRNA(Gln) amidotransferase subunit A, partial [uncultured Gemmatimonadaceae bacterium]